MGHRKELKNIANSIIYSFKSRNNDIDGYWELGKLYKFANSMNTDTVELDLLSLKIKPESKEFFHLVESWQSKLSLKLNSRKIPFSWLSSATIVIKFDQKYDEKYHFWDSSIGEHCTCFCKLVTDNGSVYTITTGTNCRPHDPIKECRSNRRIKI